MENKATPIPIEIKMLLIKLTVLVNNCDKRPTRAKPRIIYTGIEIDLRFIIDVPPYQVMHYYNHFYS